MESTFSNPTSAKIHATTLSDLTGNTYNVLVPIDPADERVFVRRDGTPAPTPCVINHQVKGA